jgi:hypothetical protein
MVAASGAMTSGSTPIGVYVSAITGEPASADLLLETSGAVLTGTRTHAAGTGDAITYKVTLDLA